MRIEVTARGHITVFYNSQCKSIDLHFPQKTGNHGPCCDGRR